VRSVDQRLFAKRQPRGNTAAAVPYPPRTRSLPRPHERAIPWIPNAPGVEIGVFFPPRRRARSPGAGPVPPAAARRLHKSFPSPYAALTERPVPFDGSARGVRRSPAPLTCVRRPTFFEGGQPPAHSRSLAAATGQPGRNAALTRANRLLTARPYRSRRRAPPPLSRRVSASTRGRRPGPGAGGTGPAAAAWACLRACRLR
jgi:hypothetical protein